MPQSLYTPFFGDMMGGVADRSKEKRTAGLARDAYMGDPAALQDLAGMDPQLAMQVEDQSAQRKELSAQEDLRKSAEARRVAGEGRAVAGEEREVDEAFQGDVQRYMEGVAQFSDYESSQRYGERGLGYLKNKYPERFGAGTELPQEYDQEGFNEISTAAGSLKTQAGNEERFFNNLIADLTPEQQQTAKEVKAGITPRATGSAELTAMMDGLTEQLGDHRAIVNEKAKFGEKTGASRATAIDDGFASVQAIDKNLRNLDKAVDALDAGAGTGAVESMFPSFKAASIALDNVQKRLGLDVIGSVTFGALSQGELDLALETAMPTNLSEPDLRQWLLDRKAAQTKLRSYYMDQMEFLEEGGTVGGFMRKQRKDAEAETAKPTSKAEYDALPSGTWYMKDGQRRRKK